jgi:ABC-type uncharacterized transport system permease subunit
MVRLQVLCFAGTYALALLCELARVVVRAPVRWYLTVALTALAWAVAAIGLYLMVHSPRMAVGTFALPIVLALTALAGTSAPRQADWRTTWSGATAFWGMIHGAFLLAGAVSTCVAFVAGLMYLAQAYRLKHKRPPRFGFTLPSLELSERLNRGAVMLAFPLLTFGLLIGVILSLELGAHTAGGTAPLRWTDPKVLSALVMWIVFAALVHARLRPELRGRAVMLLTIVAFAFLVFTWVGVEVLRLPTRHGGSSARAAATAGRAL